MVRATPLIGGILLILAGAFQFSQLKNACLTHCRTPVGFIMTEWKDGNRGALQMGIKHGYYCVGCCWLLMALREKKGRPTHLKLADEFVAAYKREGAAMTRRENVHRMAEANKAFAHFAW